MATTVIWEKCRQCGKEYRYPHLCREHMLCGLCHPPVESKSVLRRKAIQELGENG